MIDPFNLVRPVSNTSELALFACSVQGKQSAVQADKLNNLFCSLYEIFSVYEGKPFACIRALTDDELEDALKSVGLGQYTRLHKAFRQLSDYKDEHKFTLHELLAIFGIGPKTARFILGYGWNEPVAILDTHILKFLRANGIPAPVNTPQDPNEYARLETAFLRLANAKGLSLLDMDTEVWKTHCKG